MRLNASPLTHINDPHTLQLPIYYQLLKEDETRDSRECLSPSPGRRPPPSPGRPLPKTSSILPSAGSQVPLNLNNKLLLICIHVVTIFHICTCSASLPLLCTPAGDLKIYEPVQVESRSRWSRREEVSICHFRLTGCLFHYPALNERVTSRLLSSIRVESALLNS